MAHTGAFEGVITDPLPGRTAKPRTQGETMVIDKGLGLSETSDLLEMASDYIDYIKLTFGTAGLYSTALLKAKVALIRSYGVAVYPGGTFLEVAWLQGRAASYLERARALGFTHIEMCETSVPNVPPVEGAGAHSGGRPFYWRFGGDRDGRPNDFVSESLAEMGDADTSYRDLLV